MATESTLPSAYRYEMPADQGHVKDFVDIWRTEVLGVGVQIVRNGGETNLHAHNGVDSMWYVLGGTAAFYDEAENKYVLTKNESIVLPGGTKYWFESVGDEALEVLHITGRDPAVVPSRTDVTPIPDRIGRIPHFEAQKLEPVSS